MAEVKNQFKNVTRFTTTHFKQLGNIYVFLELILGIVFLSDYNPSITNWAAIIVMTISIIGVF